MTPISICTCAGRDERRRSRCAVHASPVDFADGDITPLQLGVSLVLDGTEASLLQLLNEHRRGCQLCWFDLEQHRSCAAGVLLREAWFRSFELLTQPTRWAVVEVLTPLAISQGAAL